MVMKKKKLVRRIMVSAVCFLILLRIGFFIQQIKGTSLADALKRPTEITYVYKKGCPDCHKSNPYIFVMAFFSYRRVNFVSFQDKDHETAQKIGLNSVPALITDHKIMATNNVRHLLSFMLGKRNSKQMTQF